MAVRLQQPERCRQTTEPKARSGKLFTAFHASPAITSLSGACQTGCVVHQQQQPRLSSSHIRDLSGPIRLSLHRAQAERGAPCAATILQAHRDSTAHCLHSTSCGAPKAPAKPMNGTKHADPPADHGVVHIGGHPTPSYACQRVGSCPPCRVHPHLQPPQACRD